MIISGYFLAFSGFFFPEKTKAANGELTRGRKILNFLLYSRLFNVFGGQR